MRGENCDEHTVTIRPRIWEAMERAEIAYPTTKIRVNDTGRKCPHKVHRMEMKTAISCTILRHTKILIAVGVSMEIGRAVKLECRDRGPSRMPSSACKKNNCTSAIHQQLLKHTVSRLSNPVIHTECHITLFNTTPNMIFKL